MTSKRKLRRRIEELETVLSAERWAADRRKEWTYQPPDGVISSGFTIRCTCPPNRGDNYAGTCPIHDVHTTLTAITEARA